MLPSSQIFITVCGKLFCRHRELNSGSSGGGDHHHHDPPSLASASVAAATAPLGNSGGGVKEEGRAKDKKGPSWAIIITFTAIFLLTYPVTVDTPLPTGLLAIFRNKNVTLACGGDYPSRRNFWLFSRTKNM